MAGPDGSPDRAPLPEPRPVSGAEGPGDREAGYTTAPGGPTAAGRVLNQMVPVLVQLARAPGLVLLGVASLAVAMFAVLGLFLGRASTGWGAWVPFVLAILLAVPVLALAVRRARLQRRTDGLRMTVLGGVEVLVRRDSRDGPGPGERPGRDRELFEAAVAEVKQRRARFLPRIEAAQRAARTLVGGTAHAPYLKDDLRVTLLVLIGTALAVPLGLLGAFVTALLLAAA